MVLVVTGGGGGMGGAAAQRFAREGAQVYALGRSPEPLERVATGSGRITPLVCDVSDSASIAGAMATSGTPDVLIHTAGLNTS